MPSIRKSTRASLKRWVYFDNLDEEEDQLPVFTNETLLMGNGKSDPNAPEEFDEESEEDMDDYTIKKTDALILAGKIV